MKRTLKIESGIVNAKNFEVDPEQGLTSEQVEIRKSEKLVNKTEKHVTKSYFRIFMDNVFTFFNILLLVIAIFLLAAGITDFFNFGNSDIRYYFFILILSANVLIGLFEDIHARRLTDKLRVVSSYESTVIRDGKEEKIDARSVVLSDIVILKTGDTIIADGKIISGEIEVNESILTGESIDVKKKKNSEVFAGSYVTSGTAKVLVTKVGRANYVEKLQEEAKAFKRPKSEIIRSLKVIFKVIGGIVISLGIALIITYVSWKELGLPLSNYKDAVKTISGSLVSMIPAGMYLLTSGTLAIGVISLSRKRMLVQELYSIEMLARVDVLCLDKTGTITDGTMNVKEIVPLGKNKVEDIEKILISLVKATGDTNGTAKAILNAYEDKELIGIQKAFAFNSKNKLSAVRATNGMSYVLGAREFVKVTTEEIGKKCAIFESRGERVLVVGQSKKPYEEDADLKFEIIGLLILEDHIRDDAAENIAWFTKNGVDIRIISGDNALSVSKIAQKVGVRNAEKYISLEGKTPEEVALIADKYTVFGRVNPNQKEVLVRTLREKGHTVAMTGDGVNDVLALKSADCSIAMASGSAAARNASHLVSLDSNFSNLPAVVAEGRRVINNLQRTCSLFLVKTIFAIVLTSIFLVKTWAMGVGGSHQIYPFSTPNMFIWEYLSIGFAALFLSIQPNNEKVSGGFVYNVVKRAVPSGLAMVFIVLITFIISWIVPEYLSSEAATGMSVLLFSAFSFVVLFGVCFKFDVFRSFVFYGLLIVSIILLVIDMFSPIKIVKLDIHYGAIQPNLWWILFVVFIIGIAVYTGLIALFREFERRSKGKLEKALNKGERK